MLGKVSYRPHNAVRLSTTEVRGVRHNQRVVDLSRAIERRDELHRVLEGDVLIGAGTDQQQLARETVCQAAVEQPILPPGYWTRGSLFSTTC